MIDVWTLERVFREAWPALEEYVADGWVARLTGGDTRRPNAINPLSSDAGEVMAALDRFGGYYQRAGLRQIVRVPEFCPAADAALAAAGYLVEGTTRTIAADLSGRAMPDHPGLALDTRPDADWIMARVGPGGDPATEALLDRLSLPAVFAMVREDEVPAAIGYAVIDSGFAVIESIRTDAAFRGRGLGTVCVGALLAASAKAGASMACLQVDAANVAGLALYRGLGFDRQLYNYHYRVPA